MKEVPLAVLKEVCKRSTHMDQPQQQEQAVEEMKGVCKRSTHMDQPQQGEQAVGGMGGVCKRNTQSLMSYGSTTAAASPDGMASPGGGMQVQYVYATQAPVGPNQVQYVYTQQPAANGGTITCIALADNRAMQAPASSIPVQHMGGRAIGGATISGGQPVYYSHGLHHPKTIGQPPMMQSQASSVPVQQREGVSAHGGDSTAQQMYYSQFMPMAGGAQPFAPQVTAALFRVGAALCLPKHAGASAAKGSSCKPSSWHSLSRSKSP